jgi:phosphoglycolate phosphatase-like HAD superfamily hydrolase
MIRCVVFDFDGTIRQSVSIKHEAYFVAVRGIERGDEIFRDIIRDFPTMTRFSGCALFAERARALGIDTPSGEELAERYSRACEDAIAACPEVPGAGAFLDWLRPQGIDCFVVSGTPQIPLRETVRRIGLEDRFVDVLGDPTGKPQHYADILARTGHAPEALLAIGDGDDDKAAAFSVGGQFVRVKGGAGAVQTGEWAVNALTEICAIPELVFPEA